MGPNFIPYMEIAMWQEKKPLHSTQKGIIVLQNYFFLNKDGESGQSW